MSKVALSLDVHAETIAVAIADKSEMDSDHCRQLNEFLYKGLQRRPEESYSAGICFRSSPLRTDGDQNFSMCSITNSVPAE